MSPPPPRSCTLFPPRHYSAPAPTISCTAPPSWKFDHPQRRLLNTSASLLGVGAHLGTPQALTQPPHFKLLTHILPAHTTTPNILALFITTMTIPYKMQLHFTYLHYTLTSCHTDAFTIQPTHSHKHPTPHPLTHYPVHMSLLTTTYIYSTNHTSHHPTSSFPPTQLQLHAHT